MTDRCKNEEFNTPEQKRELLCTTGREIRIRDYQLEDKYSELGKTHVEAMGKIKELEEKIVELELQSRILAEKDDVKRALLLLQESSPTRMVLDGLQTEVNNRKAIIVELEKDKARLDFMEPADYFRVKFFLYKDKGITRQVIDEMRGEK